MAVAVEIGADRTLGRLFQNSLPKALLVSAVLHAFLLMVWRPAFTNLPVGGNRVMSVRLIAPPARQTVIAASVPAVESTSASHETTAEISPEITSSKPGPLAVANKPRQSRAEQKPATKTVTPTTVEEQDAGGARSLTEGKVNVVLVISEDGRVGSIVWRQVPALTYEQLNQVETAIRKKHYRATGEPYPVNELVDVFAYLKQ